MSRHEALTFFTDAHIDLLELRRFVESWGGSWVESQVVSWAEPWGAVFQQEHQINLELLDASITDDEEDYQAFVQQHGHPPKSGILIIYLPEAHAAAIAVQQALQSQYLTR